MGASQVTVTRNLRIHIHATKFCSFKDSLRLEIRKKLADSQIR